MIERDVVIAGAGLAGATAAVLLARQGLKVTLIDPRKEFPPLFRAEKIEADQADLLRKFDLLDAVKPRARMIREIVRAKGGRIRHRHKVEQFGISYQDIVNQVRDQVPPEVEFRVGRIQSISADPLLPKIEMADGETYAARAVLLCTGVGSNLAAQLGVEKDMVADELSMAFGFVLARADGSNFPFDAVTYRPSTTRDHVGYLTLFRIGEILRGNLFTYWSARGTETQAFMRGPKQELERLLPGLQDVLGGCVIQGRVEACRIDLYRLKDCLRPGVVMVADTYQSVCPSSGMGLSKVLTDVDVLCNDCIPRWFATPGLGVDKLAEFYADSRKRAVDDEALNRALRSRRVATDRSLPWQARRMLSQWRWATGR
jgi:2-polyprenyl-6-methoxyphenol hydroxylase-like FAD-dependent oxidoreductase